MTRYWLTIFLAMVLAGLGGYVYFVELPAERAQTLIEAETWPPARIEPGRSPRRFQPRRIPGRSNPSSER